VAVVGANGEAELKLNFGIQGGAFLYPNVPPYFPRDFQHQSITFHRQLREASTNATSPTTTDSTTTTMTHSNLSSSSRDCVLFSNAMLELWHLVLIPLMPFASRLVLRSVSRVFFDLTRTHVPPLNSTTLWNCLSYEEVVNRIHTMQDACLLYAETCGQQGVELSLPFTEVIKRVIGLSAD
jgi:hypothetical protein